LKSSEELQCPCGIVGNISVNNTLWNLFRKIWIFDVEHIDSKFIFITKNSNKLAKKQVLEGKIS
jgi:hypothetical protein